MKQIIASVFLTYYLILLGISFFVFLNLIIIAAKLAEANFFFLFFSQLRGAAATEVRPRRAT